MEETKHSNIIFFKTDIKTLKNKWNTPEAKKTSKKTYDEVTMKLGRGIWNLQHNFNLSGLTSKRPQSRILSILNPIGFQTPNGRVWRYPPWN